jgi:hypothetical protein
MEADWEVEIGPDAPIIDAHWAGWVDLRRDPALARQLPESSVLPGLADTLAKLNSLASTTGIWTAKCDVWPIEDQDLIDPYELDALQSEVAYGWACYLDLVSDDGQSLRRSIDSREDLAAAISWCKSLCNRLHSHPLRCCRIDLIVRKAAMEADVLKFGVTAYLTACGANSRDAKLQLSEALSRFANGFGYSAKVE